MSSDKQSDPAAPAAEDKTRVAAHSDVEPPDVWKDIQRLVFKRFGLAGLVILLAGVFVVSQWDKISALPGIKPLVSRISQDSLPQAEPGRFNIAIAHLEGDDDHSMERTIRNSLTDQFPSARTMSFDRLISDDNGDRAGHERAQALLKASGFDLMVWGDCLKDCSLPRLFITASNDQRSRVSAGRYKTVEDENLPPLFWQDLTDVLSLVVATTATNLRSHPGQYEVDKLAGFIQRVALLLKNSKTAQWNETTRASVQVNFGNAQRTYGDWSGKLEPLNEAVTAYREALKVYTPETAPVQWALIQILLGDALTCLGERQSDPAPLHQAVTALHQALMVFTRANAPNEWALTMQELGAALNIMGAHLQDPRWLYAAVFAYEEALKEHTREKTPLYWAGAQIGLGNAYIALGTLEQESGRLRQAASAYRWALEEVTREKTPLLWGTTQTSLGAALSRLGKMRADTALLKEAVGAQREALKEVTRDTAPLPWATTQEELGTALALLGVATSDSQRLQQGIVAYREALKERTVEKVPLLWARTQKEIGNALEELGNQESNPARLEEAAAAYRTALEVYRVAKADFDAKVVQMNLQRVEFALRQEKSLATHNRK